MKASTLRAKLGLTRAIWARALGVNDRTVNRWEDDNTEPQGLAAEVIRGISLALDDGADPKRVGRLIGMGVGALLHDALTKSVARGRA